MCVMSMVHDHYRPLIPMPEAIPLPWIETIPAPQPLPFPYTPPAQQPIIDIEAFKKILEDFAKAKQAAETVDKLTGQPDCVDPEKAKLEERVKELERRIAELEKARPTFIIDGLK